MIVKWIQVLFRGVQTGLGRSLLLLPLGSLAPLRSLAGEKSRFIPPS